ncbi:XrtA/PEP-CTERM system TPR-repeat protein PrsT [uncultured Paraglaciecola sp.]|uniref:XrtA/PEP-CTERM system TPR-repeat protein PrsT n=1 Tax=uncultured Paraglaciecola sp. TaxID=1765024 RepID=UPI0030D7CA17|tara:strand:+ start:98134 stop:100875 length:2742 start_codon:yes stop_codon:yes gene_type:complete
MKKSKLGRVLFTVILVITIIGCDKKSSEESVTIAQTYIHENKLEAAIIELKNAVQQAPEVPATRLLLGQLYFETGQLAVSEKELNKALDLGSNVNDVLPLLSQVYYYSEQFDLALSMSLDGLTEPQALSTVSLIRFLTSLRDTPLELEELLTGLSELDKLLAQSYEAFRVNDIQQSTELLQKLKQSNYRPVDTEYLQAKLNYKEGDYKGAAESFAKVNQLMPYKNSVDFQEVEALIKAKLYDVAENKTDVLLKINQDHPLLNLFKANIAYDKEEYERALGHAEKSIQNGVDTPKARLIAGVSAYKVDALEKAYQNLINLSNRDGVKNSDVQRLLAHVQLSLGYSDDAANSIRSMTDLRVEDVDLFSQAGMKLAAIGDLTGAKELLAKATELDGSNVSSKYREAMVNIGTDEKAVIDSLSELLAQDPAVSNGWMHLAMAHVRNGDPKAALEVANKWAQTDPVNGETLKGVVYFKNNDTERAITALKAALEINPKQMGAHQYLLLAYEKAQQYDALYLQAKQVLTFSPDNILALVSIAMAGQVLDKSKEADLFLTQMIEHDKGNLSANVALAMSAKFQGEQQRVIDILAPHDSSLPSLGKLLLGDTYLLLGQTDLALTTYQTWKGKSPSTLIPFLRVIGLSERKGDDNEALKLTEDALKQFPNQPALQMLKVNFLTKLGRLSEARKLVSLLKSLDTDESFDLLGFYEGQLALGEKNYPLAEELLANHYKNSPSFTSAIMLAMAMQGNSHINAAKEILEAELAKMSSPPTRMRHTVAEFFQHNGLYKEAATQYDILLKEEGETPASLNNLAFVLQQDKQLDKALLLAKKALTLIPNSPQIMDTLGWIEYEMGNLPEAYKNLNEALRLAPNANSIMLHLAEVRIALGQQQQAKELLKKLVKPSKGQMEHRQSLLKTI